MRKMLAFITCLGLGGATGVAFAHGQSAGEGQDNLQMSQLPQPVQNTLRREAAGNRIEEIRESTDQNGNVFYKAEVVKGKTGTDLKLSSDGKILDRSSHNEAAEHQRGEQ